MTCDYCFQMDHSNEQCEYSNIDERNRTKTTEIKQKTLKFLRILKNEISESSIFTKFDHSDEISKFVDPNGNTKAKEGAMIGGIIGMHGVIVGATVGASFGSVVPGLGTLIGGTVGAVTGGTIGMISGNLGGAVIGSFRMKKESERSLLHSS